MAIKYVEIELLDLLNSRLLCLFQKEASGRCLFPKLNGVQVVGGSNPLPRLLVRYKDLLAPDGVGYHQDNRVLS